MSKIIWTLWWQGEENAPELVKKCIESMKIHANGAEVVVLDESSVGNYIQLPDRVKSLFEKGNISITHLSDLIRFRLLYQYGGLWLDSTIYVAQDIPADLFEQEFYTIKNGTGIDKNIANSRWTAFLVGGRKKNPVFKYMNRLFDRYWELNDELICYFLIDFCMNEVYESIADCRRIIDAVPSYVGNVLILADRLNTVEDIGKVPAEGMFHKLSYKDIPHRDGKLRKLKSLCRHIRELFNIHKWRKWGFRIAWATFVGNCARSLPESLGSKAAAYYNRVMGGYWRTIGEIFRNK